MPSGEHPILELCKCLDARHWHNFKRETQSEVDIYEKLRTALVWHNAGLFQKCSYDSGFRKKVDRYDCRPWLQYADALYGRYL